MVPYLNSTAQGSTSIPRCWFTTVSQLFPFAKRKKRHACIYIQSYTYAVCIYIYIIYIHIIYIHMCFSISRQIDISAIRNRSIIAHVVRIALPAGRRFPWCAEHSWWSHLDLVRSNRDLWIATGQQHAENWLKSEVERLTKKNDKVW